MTTVECPCCQAQNSTGRSCRRCKADLGLLWDLEASIAAEFSAARRAIAQGSPDLALDFLDRADALAIRPESAALRALAHLSAGQFSHAWTIANSLDSEAKR